jgi:hypothetical protein
MGPPPRRADTDDMTNSLVDVLVEVVAFLVDVAGLDADSQLVVARQLGEEMLCLLENPPRLRSALPQQG